MRIIKAEDRKLAICPTCSEEFGEWKVVNCAGECGEPIQDGEEVVCDEEGRHWCLGCARANEIIDSKGKFIISGDELYDIENDR